MSHWLLFWAPIWAACVVIGAAVSWFVGDLARGKNPRRLELTRYVWAGWRRRRGQYWFDYYTAQGRPDMAQFVQRMESDRDA